MGWVVFIFFFFSSRRRHTRSDRDWSSDVCSSDLFERMNRFGERLPKLRRATAADLKGDELSHARVLACTVRLLDVGMFRIGSEQYADDDAGIGLATIRKERSEERRVGKECRSRWSPYH